MRLITVLLLIASSVHAQCIISGVFQCNDGNACTSDHCDWNPRTGQITCQYEQRDCNDNDICTIDECEPDAAFPFYQCTHDYLGCCCNLNRMSDDQRRQYLRKQSREANANYREATKAVFSPDRFWRKKSILEQLPQKKDT